MDRIKLIYNNILHENLKHVSLFRYSITMIRASGASEESEENSSVADNAGETNMALASRNIMKLCTKGQFLLFTSNLFDFGHHGMATFAKQKQLNDILAEEKKVLREKIELVTKERDACRAQVISYKRKIEMMESHITDYKDLFGELEKHDLGFCDQVYTYIKNASRKRDSICKKRKVLEVEHGPDRNLQLGENSLMHLRRRPVQMSVHGSDGLCRIYEMHDTESSLGHEVTKETEAEEMEEEEEAEAEEEAGPNLTIREIAVQTLHDLSNSETESDEGESNGKEEEEEEKEEDQGKESEQHEESNISDDILVPIRTPICTRARVCGGVMRAALTPEQAFQLAMNPERPIPVRMTPKKRAIEKRATERRTTTEFLKNLAQNEWSRPNATKALESLGISNVHFKANKVSHSAIDRLFYREGHKGSGRVKIWADFLEKCPPL